MAYVEFNFEYLHALLKKEETKKIIESSIKAFGQRRFACGVDIHRVRQLGGKRSCFIDHQGVSTPRSGPRASAKEAPSPAPACLGGEPQFRVWLKQSGFAAADRWHCVCGLNTLSRARCAVRSTVLGRPSGCGWGHQRFFTSTRLAYHNDLRLGLMATIEHLRKR